MRILGAHVKAGDMLLDGRVIRRVDHDGKWVYLSTDHEVTVTRADEPIEVHERKDTLIG